MSTPTARYLLALLALVAASAVACTDDDDTASTSSATNTTAPSTASPPKSDPTAPATTSTSTTAPATTTTLPPLVATRSVVGPATDDDESAWASAVLAPANGRGWLLLGTRQPRPGEPTAPAVWESADGVGWSNGAGPPADGSSASTSSGVWHGAELIIGGQVIDDTGVGQPAIWSAPDGRTFGEPDNPFDMPGWVDGVAGLPDGLIVAGTITRGAVRHTPVVALRRGTTWTSVALPVPGGAEAWASSIVTNGTSVVVTGWVDVGDVVQAAAWASVDGGAKFASGDVSSVHTGRGSSLGTVVASPHGYVAAACTANWTTNTTALAVSADGMAWRRVDVTATFPDGEPYPNVRATCDSLVAAGDRLIVGTVDLALGHLLDVGIDGVGTAWVAPRRRRRAAAHPPLVIALPDGLAAVGRETRGLSSGRARADTDIPTGTGLPPGGPETTSLVLMPVGDELLARAVRYPIVEEGSGDGYTFGPEQIWSRTSDWSTWLLADDALPRGAEFARRGDGPLEVAFSSGDDPADNDLAGGLAGTVAWARSSGQPWTEVGLIVSGPGGDGIDDAVPIGAGFVAVGSSSVRDEQGVTTLTPVVRAAADGLDWRPETPPAPSNRSWLDRACPLTGGGVLAVGGAIVDGVSDLYMVRRDSAGVWSTVDTSTIPTDVDSFADCALVGSSTVLVATTDDQPIAVLTTDASSFEILPIPTKDAVSASINALVVHDGRLIGAGGVVDELGRVDVALWTSTDGRSWTRVAVDGFDDPSDQTASDVALTPDGHLVVAGFDRGAPVTWSLPPP